MPTSRARGNKAADPDVCKIPRGNRCFGIVPRPGVPAAASAATPAVTLRDIASFRPAPGVQQMEPNGWVVPGLDANFYAIVSQQLVDGTLLGQPATVRFTPVSYHWNYGDGTAAIRSTKGGTWAPHGLARLRPQPHQSRVRDRGRVRHPSHHRLPSRVPFGASDGFVPIAGGTISLPANDLHVTVTGAKTVLVEHDCVANPAGPGC